MKEQVYKNAIFAGGGSRCFWQLGFWDGANSAGLPLSETVEYAASTSAGCAIATAALLGRGREALDIFKEMTDRNPANIHWENLWPGNSKPLLPHIHMYRECLTRFLSPRDLTTLANRRLEFLMSEFPVFLPGVLGVLVAFSVYGLEKHLTGAVHPVWTGKLGFRPRIHGNQDAQGIDEFVEMILSASCVPPVLPSKGFRGRAVLDGGIIDNVPAMLSDDREGATIVLLSKRYKGPVPSRAGRLYVQPSEAIKIDKFDYANPDGLQETYDLGLRDGALFAAQQVVKKR